MSTQAQGRSNHNPKEPAANHSRGGDSAESDFAGRAKHFVQRARATATGLPSQLDEQLKRKPYAVLGVAGALGLAAGIVLSSRVLRAVLMATLSAAALELTRALVRQGVSGVDTASSGLAA
jgi:ElaB/YqjD/DUF883 family membrane-anchored ribosome-binding protein